MRGGKGGGRPSAGSGRGAPENLDAGGRGLAYWQAMAQVLRLEDWDKRVRISSGTHDGARVGSVATVPAVGIKLALRKAMLEQADAEIRAALLAEALGTLRFKRAAAAWLWFAAGGLCIGAVATALRYGMG